VVVIGEEEIKSSRIKVKSMDSGSEEEIDLAALTSYIKERICPLQA
jgi:histidyl-tRNA synthetase